MKNVIIAGIMAGVALFMWSFLSWVVLPWHSSTINAMPNGEEIVSLMAESLQEHRVYHYPGYPEEDSETAMQECINRMKQGPNLHFMVYNPQGFDPLSMSSFLTSLLLNILTGIASAWLLWKAVPGLSGFARKLGFVVIVGATASLVGPVADWNWWYFPLDFTAVMVADILAGFTLMGAILAWRIK